MLAGKVTSASRGQLGACSPDDGFQTWVDGDSDRYNELTFLGSKNLMFAAFAIVYDPLLSLVSVPKGVIWYS